MPAAGLAEALSNRHIILIEARSNLGLFYFVRQAWRVAPDWRCPTRHGGGKGDL
jgi:hypothetical protein